MFDTYLKQIAATPLLTAEQESDLAAKVAQGDAAARDHMVRANLRLVVKIARAYSGKGVSLQDLIEEGNLGLIHAVDRFDIGHGARFATYAAIWIKKHIRMAFAALPSVAYVSTYDAIVDGNAGRPDADLVAAEDCERVRHAVSKMKPREAAVLKMRFGFDGGEEKTLNEIGEVLGGLTRERVRQIEAEALGNLAAAC